MKITKLFLEAGLPELGLQCITGSGSRIGPALCRDSRVRKISFTGSVEVGEAITSVAGIKKMSLELGSNSPAVVMPDADLELVNAGQVCISTQRVLVQEEIYGDLLDCLKPKVEALKIGGSLEEGTKLIAMISE